MGNIVFDESEWPIVVVRYPAEFSDAEWEAHAKAFDTLLDRRQAFALLSDACNTRPPNAKERKFAAERLAAQRDNWKLYCVANAFCTPNALLRGVLTAISWVSPTPFPQRFFANVPAGSEWLRAMLPARDSARA